MNRYGKVPEQLPTARLPTAASFFVVSRGLLCHLPGTENRLMARQADVGTKNCPLCGWPLLPTKSPALARPFAGPEGPCASPGGSLAGPPPGGLVDGGPD